MKAIRVDRAVVAPLAVGASELGAVLGCDPWTTPLQLYRRKRGLDPEVADNPRMRIGRLLEEPVVRLARERIPLGIRRNTVTLAHHTVPLFATPDAFVGRDRLLEAKVVGLRGASDWEDGPPCRVRLQAQGQLLVTDREACYVAALIGTELRLELVEADPEVQYTIVDAVYRFVELLDAGIPPDPLTYEERWTATLEAGDRDGSDVLAGAELQLAGDRVLELRAEAARLEDETDALRLELLAGLAAGGSRLLGNGWAATLEDRGGSIGWKAIALELAARLDGPPSDLADLVTLYRGAPTTSLVVRARKESTRA